MGSDAFKFYLTLLRFPTNEILSKFFSCNSCVSTIPDGSLRWSGVVMDGTATGILSKLPRFEMSTKVLPSVKSTKQLQFTLGRKLHRDFLDSIFTSAKRNEGKIVYCVDHLRSVAPDANELYETFLTSSTIE